MLLKSLLYVVMMWVAVLHYLYVINAPFPCQKLATKTVKLWNIRQKPGISVEIDIFHINIKKYERKDRYD